MDDLFLSSLTSGDIVELIVALLGGTAAGGGIFTAIHRRKKMKTDYVKSLMDTSDDLMKRWKEFFEEEKRAFQAKIKRLEEDIVTLKEEARLYKAQADAKALEISELREKVALLDIFGNNMFFPVWIKGLPDRIGCKMLYINDQYCNLFGVKREEYVFKYDKDYWGMEVHRNFRKADLWCFNNRHEFWVGVENIKNANGNFSNDFVVIKKAAVENEVVRFIWGCCIPIEIFLIYEKIRGKMDGFTFDDFDNSN